MAAPSMVSRSGDNLVVRSVVSGDALFGTDDKEDGEDFNYFNPGSEPEEEEDENGELPQCKIKRNYSCSHCDYYTQNPRFYLYHQKQVHNEKIKIYECDHCLYASKHSQKLQRHVHMVHVMGAGKRKVIKSKPKVKNVKSKPSEVFQEQQEDEPTPLFGPDGTQIYKCSVCDMTSKSQGLVVRHERVVHLKKKFYRCSKCNYVTHMKARYTKHVKYHSMPMIKCELCDFKTPYKWNLDRHNKNHMGDGPFRCSICNFTAEIKQSLTVHEMNHHVPPVGLNVVMNNSRRRLKVGASDTMGMVTEEDQIEQSELELLRMEREGAYDQIQNPADYVQAQLDIPSEPTNSLSGSEQSLVDQLPETPRPPIIQIKKYTCRVCSYEGNLGEVQRHESSVHNLTTLFEKKKTPRPIPNLIPIQPKTVDKPQSLSKENISQSSLKDFASLIGDEFKPDQENSMSPQHQEGEKKTPDLFKKKNASFFDKLKEKLMTSASETNLSCSNCGFEAKCLSEYMKHQKIHIQSEGDESEASSGSQGFPSSELSSTRCQHCRQRCKTSADLKLHLQNCDHANPVKSDEEKEQEPSEDPQSHPMENRVFVWNTIDDPKTDEESFSRPEEKVFVGIEVKPGYGTTTGGAPEEQTIIPRDTNTKKVFKCPHCSFWASTASRFHVHIVGHLNKRPFQCSLCHYSSNWRWDITKHIRLKTIRDPTHEKAKVLLTDETGRRNYSKYNKYLTNMKMENQQPVKSQRRIFPKDNVHSVKPPTQGRAVKRPSESPPEQDETPKKKQHPENKRTMWKCKKCYFRNNDREVVLEHVRDHYRSSGEAGKKKKKTEQTSPIPDETTNSAPETEASDPNEPSHEFMCETCPFVCNTWKELEGHSEKHFVCVVKGKQFKCQFCSYFAQDEQELMAHLDSHGEVEAGNASEKSVVHSCDLCPYVATNKSQLIYHHKCHGKEGSHHKCYKCSYAAPNNTILALHVRLHGRNGPDPQETASPKIKVASDISGVDTSRFTEIPMVWVSKSTGISKMFKCRFCPHTSMKKVNIQEHEKLHQYSSPSHKCSDCNYICNSYSQLSIHVKVHHSVCGQILGIADGRRPDQIQIGEMYVKIRAFEKKFKLKSGESSQQENSSTDVEDQEKPPETKDDRVLHFCSLCPARFLYAKEMSIHSRFHELKLPFKCDACSYNARQTQHLVAHLKVHTDEYQERTNVLTKHYEVAEENPRPRIAIVLGEKEASDSVWVVVKSDDDVKETETEPKPKQHACSKCPAEFFKTVALDYHLTLHGGPGPHKCKFCDYAVKTYGNLIRHESVHKSKPKTDQETKPKETPKSSPKSPAPALTMDPEFGILIHGSPEFVYPTYLKNGKMKEKRYKCHKCPSAFEKREQYKIHLSLHGSKQRYNCERCDYSVKYYANYTQHIKKHDSCDASRKERSSVEEMTEEESAENEKPADRASKSMKMSTADEQTAMIMQQKSTSNTLVDKDISRCPYCPYTNGRKDGVASHIKCHLNSRGAYTCKYCDYNVPQSHFLREHFKIHFAAPKHVKPDAYMKINQMEIWAEPLNATDCNSDKFLVFKDQGEEVDDRFLPRVPDRDLDSLRGRVYINLKTGEEEVELDEAEEEKENVRLEEMDFDQPQSPMTEPKIKTEVVENGVQSDEMDSEDSSRDSTNFSTSSISAASR